MQMNRAIDMFLDAPARREVRRLTSQCLVEDGSPRHVAGRWFTKERCDRLRSLLDAAEVPDRLRVACYAWPEVHEPAQVAYLLAKNRRLPQPDFSNFSQTAEEIEGGPALRRRCVNHDADRQGDVHDNDFNPDDGTEISGRRPAPSIARTGLAGATAPGLIENERLTTIRNASDVDYSCRSGTGKTFRHGGAGI